MSEMKYTHPYDELIIQDNTAYIDTVTQPNLGTILLQAFLSSKGETGKVKTFLNSSSFIKEFGKPNFREHGQAIYNILNWLDNGGPVQCLRVAAANAIYSNNMVLVKTKKALNVQVKDGDGNNLYLDSEGNITAVADGNTPYLHDTVDLIITTKTATSLTDKATLLNVLESEYDGTPDVDGYKTFPLMAFAAKGSGKYGNALYTRINRNVSLDRDSDYPNYTIETLENDNGLSVADKAINVSVFPEAINQFGENEFIADSVNSKFAKVSMEFSELNYERLCAEIKTAIAGDAENKIMDILFAVSKETGTPYQFVTLNSDSVNLGGITGIKLASGSDGDFNMTNASRDAAITAGYVNAYTGVTDASIIDRKKYPAQVMLDANFPAEVKTSMITCNTKRGSDLQVILDAGIISTVTTAKNWRDNTIMVNDYNVKLYFQHAIVTDPHTLKDIKVTMTYFLARVIPSHDISFGTHVPLAEKFAKIYGFKKNSLIPVVTTSDEKEELYTRQINYCEEVEEAIVLNTDITAQKKSSDFSEGNNIRVLNEMKKTLADLIPEWRYEFMSEADLNRFNREANTIMSEKFIDAGKTSQAVVAVTSSPEQMKRKIIQVDLGVSFYPIVKRTLQYIRVNPYEAV